MSSSKGIYNETLFKRNPEVANAPGVLYCVVLVERATGTRACIKIGITKGTSNRSVIERSAGFKGYEVRVQKIVKGTLEEVYHLEQWLHELWAHKKYKSPWKFGGHTELFEIDDEIIRSIPKNV